MQQMMAEQVEPDTFEAPCHKLKPSIEAKFEDILKNLYKMKPLFEQNI